MNQGQKKLNIRERIFKYIFIAGDRYRIFLRWLTGFCSFIIIVSLTLFILGIIFYIGFGNTEQNTIGLKYAFRVIFLLVFFAKILPRLLQFSWEKKGSQVFRIFLTIFLVLVFMTNFVFHNAGKTITNLFVGNLQIILGILIIGISELSGLQRVISSVKIPPALIFSISFLLIIFVGSGLLMMPKAHTEPLSFIDSLFTSVSSVCVTGLVVVDTATAFTTLGKIVIMCLIQIGGLGIMTFTGFFSFIFVSGSSFRDNLLLKELFSSETMNSLFSLLAKIIAITFLTEAAGALIIYRSLDSEAGDKLLFSAFHAISAFCNAGFSTLSGNLYATEVRFNTTLQISVMILIVLGGIGFPVLIGVYAKIKYFFAVILRRLQGKLKPVRAERKNVAGTIVLVSTFLLITGGALLYYFFESDKSLEGVDNLHKIIISSFGSISARTAGFNITDITLWSYPTVFIMMFLMWIGASPGSTGGGIKTTTFALAIKSTWNFIRGRDQFIIGNREISSSTVTRVLSIVFLSIVVIGAGFFSLLLTEPGKDPVKLLFECFSAYATAGLSIVDSATLTSAGKVVDMILMFVGRVGPLTLLTGFLISYRKRYSRFPEVEIVIN